MKKKIHFIFSLFLSIGLIQAQVGINTTDPHGAFHIDGGHDNSLSPTALQQLNDVVVQENGNVGIGTSPSSSAKLVINDGGTYLSPRPVLRITDGNEGEGKVLTSMDNNGRATWDMLPFEANVGAVFGTAVLPAQTIPYGIVYDVQGFSYRIDRPGYYAFQIRWWGRYMAQLPIPGGAGGGTGETATHFYLNKNGVTVDQFEAYGNFNSRNDEKLTVYVPLYGNAVVGDVFTLSVRLGISYSTDMELINDSRGWMESKVTVVLTDL